MAFEELKHDLNEAQNNVQSYIKNSEEYVYLKSFKIAMKLVTSFAQVLLIGALVMLAAFVLALAASYGLGHLLKSTFYGFLIVGVLMSFIAIIGYVLRKKLNQSIIRKFSKVYFDRL